LFETGWGSSYDYVDSNSAGKPVGYDEPLPGTYYSGTGGGVSHLFGQPWYQHAIVPARLARSYDGTPQRVVPDVAMLGDPYTGFLVGDTYQGANGEFDVAGTSLACPLMAGFQAVAQGHRKPIGFANPLLYHLSIGDFHDIVPASRAVAVVGEQSAVDYLVTFEHDSTLFTARGFDDMTGRGTPRGTAFVAAERSAMRS
jgi:subtilase family serine protease